MVEETEGTEEMEMEEAGAAEMEGAEEDSGLF
jgi:hypothetical protein